MYFEKFDDPDHQIFYNAIVNKDVVTVESLLSGGTNVNMKLKNGFRVTSPLHHAPNLEMTKLLLTQGADVNAEDNFSFTPLHYAVILQKDLKIASELVKNGANPNAFSCRGETPLHYAVVDCQFDMIELLLYLGADINASVSGLKFPTALGIALEKNISCAKFLVKRNVLLHYEHYEDVVRLGLYTDRYSSSYADLSHFLKNCVKEVEKMRCQMLNNNLSLYEYVLKYYVIPKPLNITVEISEKDITGTFPIYSEIISRKLKLGLERTYLLKKLCEIQISSRSNEHTEDEPKDGVTLNKDCTFMIFEYLSNTDLHYLIKSFDNNFYTQSLITLLEIDQYLIPGIDLINIV